MFATSNSTTAAVDLPHGIDGLDMRLGLAHMAGKKSLYLAMLRRYADSQAAMGQQIRDAIAANDRTTAERVAHTLKSVSGTVGATVVQLRAGAVEAALKHGEPADEVGMRLVELEVPLGTLIAALQDQLCAPAAA